LIRTGVLDHRGGSIPEDSETGGVRRDFSGGDGTRMLVAHRPWIRDGDGMQLFDLLGTKVEGPDGPVLVEATFAALPPGTGGPSICTRERFLGEVRDEAGRRWHAMIEDRRARFLGPAED
tara:strand:+ start:131 stop:490 length:360 start_codon:yes stop_codon:yes gene_type:complete